MGVARTQLELRVALRIALACTPQSKMNGRARTQLCESRAFLTPLQGFVLPHRLITEEADPPESQHARRAFETLPATRLSRYTGRSCTRYPLHSVRLSGRRPQPREDALLGIYSLTERFRGRFVVLDPSVGLVRRLHPKNARSISHTSAAIDRRARVHRRRADSGLEGAVGGRSGASERPASGGGTRAGN